MFNKEAIYNFNTYMALYVLYGSKKHNFIELIKEFNHIEETLGHVSFCL